MIVNLLNNLFDISNNFDKVRDCFLALSAHRPRSPLISSSKCDEEYHIHVKRNSNRMEENKPITSVSNIQVEYISQKGRNDQVSKTANNTNNMCHQCDYNKKPALSLLSDNNMFNV